MRGNPFFVIPFIVVTVALSGCGTPRVYRDTSELERPPQLEIIATKSQSNGSAEASVAKPATTPSAEVVETKTQPSAEVATAKPESTPEASDAVAKAVSAPQPATEVATTTPESVAESKASPTAGLGKAIKMADETHLQVRYPFDLSWILVKKALVLSGIEISDRNREKGQYYVEFDPDLVEFDNESTSFFEKMFVEDEYPKARYLLTLNEVSQSVYVKADFLEYISSEAKDNPNLPDRGTAKLLKRLYLALHDHLPLE